MSTVEQLVLKKTSSNEEILRFEDTASRRYTDSYWFKTAYTSYWRASPADQPIIRSISAFAGESARNPQNNNPVQSTPDKVKANSANWAVIFRNVIGWKQKQVSLKFN